ILLVNLLLAGLPAEELHRLERFLEPVELKLRQNLAEPEQAISYVYFPIDAVGSVVQTMSSGSTVEIGLVGREGFVGIQAWLRQEISSVDIFVQVPGRALRMKRQTFLKEVLDSNSPLNLRIAGYVDAYLLMTGAISACNRMHHINERLCRWLKMVQNRVQGDSFPMRQEFLSYMLGVHRPSISIAASALKTAGLIRYERGSLTVLDSEGLEAGCCECYDIIESKFEAVLGTPLREPSGEKLRLVK
ncbi:MAG: Crp/Fnr family transcriptional regulator, partial [Acidobacteriaceae bacterium]